MTRIILFACDVPNIVEGSGFQSQDVRGMQSAMTKSVPEGEAITKFSSSTIGRKPVEYRDILLPKSTYDIVCCQNSSQFSFPTYGLHHSTSSGSMVRICKSRA